MSENNQQHVEVVWGNQILDEGFTTIPNLIIKNYSKVGLTHGEFALLTIMFSYKHGSNDPYPSQETLAKDFYGDDYKPESSLRALRRLLKSMEDKGLLDVSHRYVAGKRVSNQYSFEPLIEACLKLIKSKEVNKSYEVVVSKKKSSNKGKKLQEQKVPVGKEQKVPVGTGTKSSGRREQKVPTKKKREKDNLKKKKEKESIYLEKVENIDLPDKIKSVLNQKIDRLILHKIDLIDIELSYKENEGILNPVEYASILSDVLEAKKYNYGFKKYMNGAVIKFIENRQKKMQTVGQSNKSGRKEIEPDWINKDKNGEAPAEIDPKIAERVRKLKEKLGQS